MATEPIQGIRYPAASDSPNGPDQFKALADDVAGRLAMRFASTAARDVALPAPTDGQVCTTGTGGTQRLWSRQNGAWVDVTQETAWTAYAVTVTGMTNATAAGKVRKVGRMLVAQIVVTFSAASVASGNGLEVSLPMASPAVAAHEQIGVCTIIDASPTARYAGVVIAPGSNPTTAVVRSLGTAGLHTPTAATSPITWAAGDTVVIDLMYPF